MMEIGKETDGVCVGLMMIINPIWEDAQNFTLTPTTKFILIHARSASFKEDKYNIEYNQPYISNGYAFVFNGLIKKVKLPFPTNSKIGSQKIWSILLFYLNKNKTTNTISALYKLKDILEKYSKEIQAINTAICDINNIYCLSLFNTYPEYYQLRLYNSDNLFILSSLDIEDYKFTLLAPGIYKY